MTSLRYFSPKGSLVTGRAGERSALDNETINRLAPSVFAEAEHSSRSDRYSMVPTINVVDALRDSGWFPVAAKQQTVRDQSRAGFQKHELRFSHRDTIEDKSGALRVGDSLIEVVLTNSHDGSSAYSIEAGIYRPICTNGMIVCESMFGRVSVRHQGFDPSQIIDVSAEIVSEAPTIGGRIEGFQALELSEDERQLFAESALMLRHDLSHPDEVRTKAPVSPERMLAPRRMEDDGRDLWKTLNVVQENAIRGGIKDWRKRNEKGKRFPQTRPVKGIDGDQKLNRALFHLAERMAELKTGGAN